MKIDSINFILSFFITIVLSKKAFFTSSAIILRPKTQRHNFLFINHLAKRHNKILENVYFVYSQTPENILNLARKIGKHERYSFAKLLPKMRNDDERMELYAKHFSQCSIINHQNMEMLENNESNNRISKLYSQSQMLSEAIGLDSASSKFFDIAPSLLAETIRRACLKNEFQFQCAYAFLDNLNKIQSHILQMKESDGSFKIMIEKECKNVETSFETNQKLDIKNSVYACFNEKAETILSECNGSIREYNTTRRETNDKMQEIYAETMTTIESHAAQALLQQDLDLLNGVLKKGEILVEKTLIELLHVEANKCSKFSLMERCVVQTVVSHCSTLVADSLQTMLRVGYLARERGAMLHELFQEAQVPEHRACKRFNIAPSTLMK